MLKVWSASRSAALSRDERVPGQFVYPVVCTAAVNCPTQFVGCFKGIEMDMLNSFFGGGGCSLWLTYLYFLGLYSKCSILLVIYWCFCQMLIKEGAELNHQHFGRARLYSRLERLHRLFFMSIQKRGVGTLLSDWQKTCILKSLVWALWAMWRGCEPERVAFVVNNDICRP